MSNTITPTSPNRESSQDFFEPSNAETRHGPTVTEDAHTIMINKVSWGAIFSGVVVGLIVHVMLTMLGIGIGIATLNVGMGAAENPTATSFSIGAGIWYVLSGIVSAYVGGYIAARLSGRTVATTGALHGLTTWAVTTLIVLYLLSTAFGSMVGGVFSGVSSAMGGLSQTIAQSAAPMLEDANPLDAIEGQIRGTGTDPEALQTNAVNAVRALVVGGQAGTDGARQQAAQAVSQARGVPLPEAQQQVAQIEQQYNTAMETARETATQAADTAASVVSTGAILAFVSLVLGAIAGWLGGRSGVVHPVYADRIVPSRRGQ